MSGPARLERIVLAATLACLPRPAFAGPPFETDDPVPVDPGHWEIDNSSSGTIVRGDAAGLAASVDANYGAAPGVQLHAVLPLAFNSQPATGARFGLGDVAAGVKYRFIDPPDGGAVPQMAIYPTVFLPSGKAAAGLGTGRIHAFLPLWLEWDFGKWTTYGGGGYAVNPGPGNRDWQFVGWLLQRHVTEELAVAAEVFHQTTSTAGGGPSSVGFPLGSKASTGFNVGAVYDFTHTYHLLVSAGRGLQNVPQTNLFTWYFGLQVTF